MLWGLVGVVVFGWGYGGLGFPASAGIPRSLRIAPPYVFDEGGVPLSSLPPLDSCSRRNDIPGARE